MERKLEVTLIDDGKEIKKAVAVLEHGNEVDFEEAAKAAFSKIKKAEPAFVPHILIKMTNSPVGEIGFPTPYHDADGKELFVGDVVEIEREGLCEHCFVIFDKKDRGPIIIGIGDCCHPKDGTIDPEWTVRKVRDHKDVLDGETYEFAMCVKSQNTLRAKVMKIRGH